MERHVDTDETLTCIDFGLLLLRVGPTRYAVLVRSMDERLGAAGLHVEVIGPDREAASILSAASGS